MNRSFGWQKLLFTLILLTSFVLGSVRPAQANCDGWASDGSQHRNSGNGCTYVCRGSSWSGPVKCDGKGNGQFQGEPAKTEEERRRQAEAVAQRNEEAKQKVAEQGAAATAAIAATTAQQRATEATRQQAMVETQRQSEVDLASRFGATQAQIQEINARYKGASEVVAEAQGTTRGTNVVGSGAANAAEIAARGYDPNSALGTGTVTVNSNGISAGTSTPAVGGGTTAPTGSSGVVYTGEGSCPVGDGAPMSVGPGGKCCRGGVTECTSGTCGAPGLGYWGKCVAFNSPEATAIEIPADIQSTANRYQHLVEQCRMDIDLTEGTLISGNGCGSIGTLYQELQRTPEGRAALAQADAALNAERQLYGTVSQTVNTCGSYNSNRQYVVNENCEQSQASDAALDEFCRNYPDRCDEARRNTANYESGLVESRNVQAQQASTANQRAQDYTRTRSQTCAAMTNAAEKQACYEAIERTVNAIYIPYTSESSSYCRAQPAECARLRQQQQQVVATAEQAAARNTAYRRSGNTCTACTEAEARKSDSRCIYPSSQACIRDTDIVRANQEREAERETIALPVQTEATLTSQNLILADETVSCSAANRNACVNGHTCVLQNGSYSWRLDNTGNCRVSEDYCSEVNRAACGNACTPTRTGGNCENSNASAATLSVQGQVVQCGAGGTNVGACVNGFLCSNRGNNDYYWMNVSDHPAYASRCRVSQPYCNAANVSACGSRCNPTLQGGTCQTVQEIAQTTSDPALLAFSQAHCPGVIPIRESNGTMRCPAAASDPLAIQGNVCNLPGPRSNARRCESGRYYCIYGGATLVNGTYICPDSTGSIVAVPPQGGQYVPDRDCPVNSVLVVNEAGQTTCSYIPEVTEANMNSYVQEHCPGQTPVFINGGYRCPNESNYTGQTCEVYGSSRDNKNCCLVNGSYRWVTNACNGPAPSNFVQAGTNALGGSHPDGTWCGNATSDHGCTWCINQRSYMQNGRAICGTAPAQTPQNSSCAQAGSATNPAPGIERSCCDGTRAITEVQNGRTVSVCRAYDDISRLEQTTTSTPVCNDPDGCLCVDVSQGGNRQTHVANGTACPPATASTSTNCSGETVAYGTPYSNSCRVGNGLRATCSSGFVVRDGLCAPVTVAAITRAAICDRLPNTPGCPGNPNGQVLSAGGTCPTGATCFCPSGYMSGRTCMQRVQLALNQNCSESDTSRCECPNGKMQGTLCVPENQNDYCFGSGERCIDGKRYTCNSIAGPVGQYRWTGQACGAAQCVPGAVQCTSDGSSTFKICRSDGTEWIENNACAAGLSCVSALGRCVNNQPFEIQGNTCTLSTAREYAVHLPQPQCGDNNYICEFGAGVKINGRWTCPAPDGNLDHGCAEGMFFETQAQECRYLPDSNTGTESFAGYQCGSETVVVNGVERRVCQACGRTGQPACQNCYGQGNSQNVCVTSESQLGSAVGGYTIIPANADVQEWTNQNYGYVCNRVGDPNCRPCGGQGQQACPVSSINQNTTVNLFRNCDDLRQSYPFQDFGFCPLTEQQAAEQGVVATEATAVREGTTCSVFSSVVLTQSQVRCETCGGAGEAQCPEGGDYFQTRSTGDACQQYLNLHYPLQSDQRPSCS